MFFSKSSDLKEESETDMAIIAIKGKKPVLLLFQYSKVVSVGG